MRAEARDRLLQDLDAVPCPELVVEELDLDRAPVSGRVQQLALVEETGSQAVLMASRALAATARSAEDYLDTYTRLLRQSAEPVILHWLGPMFDPALDGYWGSADLDTATETFLEVVKA
ncbi:dihydrodipicolinate synthase family protein, partial [Streptomyces sp. MS191]|uniref:dihydrodipicolinate synthase family protein n=1 Tax=Streptomyces sp. ms191 TaxID=1827978 RepID=UPI0021C6DD6F